MHIRQVGFLSRLLLTTTELCQRLSLPLLPCRRFIAEEAFGFRVKQLLPEALRVLDLQDLHFLRKGTGHILSAVLPAPALDEGPHIQLVSTSRAVTCGVCEVSDGCRQGGSTQGWERHPRDPRPPPRPHQWHSSRACSNSQARFCSAAFYSVLPLAKLKPWASKSISTRRLRRARSCRAR